MTLNKLTRRTPVRLAISFALLFSVLVSLIVGVLYIRLAAHLETNIRNRVEEARDTLVAIDAEKGFDELTTVVANESASVRDADSLFLLKDSSGKVVAGNATGAPVFSGWRKINRATIPAIADKGSINDNFWATWNPVSKGTVFVAMSDSDVRHTRRMLLTGLAAAVVAMTVTGSLSALALARSTQRQIDNFSETLARVADGDISSRIPLSKTQNDLDQVAVQINGTLDRLSSLIDGIKQVSTDIAHDLKTPIGRLRRSLEATAQHAETGPPVREAINTAIGDIDAIVDTFEALLRIAEIEGGARRAKFASLSLTRILADIADVYTPVAEDAGLLLSSNSARWPETSIDGDRELLTQLFANVIENAIRYCPPPGCIAIAVSRTSTAITIAIADSGPGIPEAERDKVFRRLYRLEKSRAETGMSTGTAAGHGLGLALVAAIADLHGAKVSLADNHPGLLVTITFQARSTRHHPRVNVPYETV